MSIGLRLDTKARRHEAGPGPSNVAGSSRGRQKRTVPLAVLLALALWMGMPSRAGAQTHRPNVVIILADDMGYADLGCYGSEIETPNLDRLAAGGLKFRRMYNGARCCPSRASLLTGLYAQQAGVGFMNDVHLPEEAYRGILSQKSVTIAEVLRDAGYTTIHTGKWHVGAEDDKSSWPFARGFAHVFGSPNGGLYYDLDTPLWRDGAIVAKEHDKPPAGFYSTDAWTDYAIREIADARRANRPYFLYLAHVAPHYPLQAPAELVAKYRGRYADGWERTRERRYAKQLKLGAIDSTWKLTEWPRDVPHWSELDAAERDRQDQMMATYAAVVERLDADVGRLMDAVHGGHDDTLTMFLSDNGGNAESGWRGVTRGSGRPGGPGYTTYCGQAWATVENTPFRRYKHFADEGGIATPFLVDWPAVIPASRRGTWDDTPAHIVDLMATCADVGGATIPTRHHGQVIPPTEGVSLRPAFAGQAMVRPPMFWEHEGNAAERDGDWKLVRVQGEGWRLYDSAVDRSEMTNVAHEQPERVAAMAAAWQHWADRVGVIPWEQLNTPANRGVKRE